MRLKKLLLAGLTSLSAAPLAASQALSERNTPRNVVVFVADGLRAASVNDQTAPAMAKLAREGVSFTNSHSLFPTLTMANASALVTAHALGDTGTFGNTLYVGFEVRSANSVTPFLERDDVLRDVDEGFGHNFLHEPTLFDLARAKGYSNASSGKIGPALLFDHVARGSQSIIIDDATGNVDPGTGEPQGVPLPDEVRQRLHARGLPIAAPDRGKNGNRLGTYTANVTQQDYFAAATTQVVLPLFASRKQPFLLVFWSRDPDGTQHYQGDSLQKLIPGINGPTSLAAIRNADDDLARILVALDELGLRNNTDVVVVADHGFSTISKESKTSSSAKVHYTEIPEGDAPVPEGALPPGFLALAKEFGLPLLDPDQNYALVANGHYPKFANGVIGEDKNHPKLVVAVNGGSDLVYITDGNQERAGHIVQFLLGQDYISGIFVDDRLGAFRGTLPLSSIMLKGSAITPVPAIVVSFRSFDTVCGEPLLCTVEVADTALQRGQGMHGSFSRADTKNFMAFSGPDFKAGFVDTAPTSNADITATVIELLDFKLDGNGKLVGRLLGETLRGGIMPQLESETIASAPAENGVRTMVNRQRVGNTCYVDAAGFPGRTVGLSPLPLDVKDKSAWSCSQ
ncbi:MAG: alkaline phosphatase family protein [Methyloceanibacter sp.]